jgi:hypothetical protein
MAKRAKLPLHPTHSRKKSAKKGSRSTREAAGTTTRAKAREGTRLVGAHVPEALWKALAHLRADLVVTMQALVVEALEDVVAKHRRR